MLGKRLSSNYCQFERNIFLLNTMYYKCIIRNKCTITNIRKRIHNIKYKNVSRSWLQTTYEEYLLEFCLYRFWNPIKSEFPIHVSISDFHEINSKSFEKKLKLIWWNIFPDILLSLVLWNIIYWNIRCIQHRMHIKASIIKYIN